MVKLNALQNHHTLAVANCKDKKFYYIDSLETPGEDEENKVKSFFLRFLQFYGANGQQTDDWTFECSKHIQQRDNWSCGIKVIKHFQQYMSNGTFLYKQGKEVIERSEICGFILENSINMCDNCIVCNENGGNNAYKCPICQRLFHIACINMDEIDFLDKFLDKCPLCLKYLNLI